MRERCPDCRCLTSSAPDPCPECAAERRRHEQAARTQNPMGCDSGRKVESHFNDYDGFEDEY